MNLENTGLVLEGGGLRGVYSSGVLNYLMKKSIYFPYVIGVSMGACNAANYISKQVERNKIVNISFVNDSRYLSYLRLILKGELFGMDFIFNTIPNNLIPFDYETFYNNEQKCITTVSDCISGEPLYYEKNELGKDYLKVLQASSSLPFIAKPVKFRGKILMDGGLSDSIPIKKSIKDGNKKHVLILTQPKGYRKPKSNSSKYAKIKYFKYKGLIKCLQTRTNRYNKTMDYIDQLEERGEVFVIRPKLPLNIGRVERNKPKLYEAYDKGYNDMKILFENMVLYLGK